MPKLIPKLHRSRQNGQSIAEFLVALFALAPFFLITVLLVKYGDIALNTTTATRFSAFEWAMYNKQNDEKKLNEYFFKGKEKIWDDHKGKSLIDGDVKYGGWEGRFNKWPYKYNASGALEWDHYRRVTIDVTLAELPWKVDGNYSKIVLHREAAVGFDDWSAASPKQVLRAIGGDGPGPGAVLLSGRKPGNGIEDYLNQPDDSYGLWNVKQIWNAIDYTATRRDGTTVTYPFPLPPLQQFVQMMDGVFGVEMPQIWHVPDVDLVPDDRK